MPRTIFTGTIESERETLFLEQGQELILSRNGFSTTYCVNATGYYEIVVPTGNGGRILITRIGNHQYMILVPEDRLFGVETSNNDLWRGHTFDSSGATLTQEMIEGAFNRDSYYLSE